MSFELSLASIDSSTQFIHPCHKFKRLNLFYDSIGYHELIIVSDYGSMIYQLFVSSSRTNKLLQAVEGKYM